MFHARTILQISWISCVSRNVANRQTDSQTSQAKMLKTLRSPLGCDNGYINKLIHTLRNLGLHMLHTELGIQAPAHSVKQC